MLEYLALTRTDWAAGRRAVLWEWVAWTLALSVWIARQSERRTPAARGECERLWFWFRDHWGVVWALRIAERFNRTAELAGWPVRLTWFGLEPLTGLSPSEPPDLPDEALPTLKSLLRRFARPERLDQAAEGR